MCWRNSRVRTFKNDGLNGPVGNVRSQSGNLQSVDYTLKEDAISQFGRPSVTVAGGIEARKLQNQSHLLARICLLVTDMHYHEVTRESFTQTATHTILAFEGSSGGGLPGAWSRHAGSGAFCLSRQCPARSSAACPIRSPQLSSTEEPGRQKSFKIRRLASGGWHLAAHLRRSHPV